MKGQAQVHIGPAIELRTPRTPHGDRTVQRTPGFDPSLRPTDSGGAKTAFRSRFELD